LSFIVKNYLKRSIPFWCWVTQSKQQKALKEKKTVDNENNPENIDQEMIVDVIAGSQEFMDDTAPPSQSQQPMVPLLLCCIIHKIFSSLGLF
jgi:hypothetical protein